MTTTTALERLLKSADALRDTLGKPWEYDHKHPLGECSVCDSFREYDAARAAPINGESALLAALKEISKDAPTEEPDRPENGNHDDSASYGWDRAHYHYAQIAKSALARADGDA